MSVPLSAVGESSSSAGDDKPLIPATVASPLPPSRLLTATYVAVYLMVGPALILVNKHLLKDVGFGFPMMVSGIGQASSALGSFLALRVLRLQPLTCAKHVTWPFYLRNMVVVGGATAASLCFGNAGYLYLTVSFVQILKVLSPPTSAISRRCLGHISAVHRRTLCGQQRLVSRREQAFTPVFVVVMLYATRVETPSPRVALSVGLISAATAIASAGEAHFNLTGVLIM